MITIKYSKTFPANLLSHVDTMRAHQRIFRRAGIELNFSQGFNPHMLIYMSPPPPLGMESRSEYVTADTKIADESFLSLFNQYAPKGITGEEIFITAKNPNLAAKITAAEYDVALAGLSEKLSGFVLPQKYEITYTDKGAPVTKDVGELILSITPFGQGARLALAYGNKNLKAERLLRFWCSEWGLDYNTARVVKTRVFVGDQPADEYILSLPHE